MPYPADREVLFYVTYNVDTFDRQGYEHVPKIIRCRNGLGLYGFTMPHLFRGEIPAEQQQLPDGMINWLYWKPIITPKILTNHPLYPQLSLGFEYDVDPNYLDQFPDFLYGDGTLITEKFKAALDDVAPDTCHFFPVQLFDKATGAQIDRPTWSLFTKHWIHHKRVFDTEDKSPKPYPDTDLTSGATGSMGPMNHFYSGLQDDRQAIAFMQNLGVFSLPVHSARPIFSPTVYDHLKAVGITGFDERSEIIHHETPLKEVIGHVWKR